MNTCRNLGLAHNYLLIWLFTLNYIQSHLISLHVHEYFVKVESINKKKPYQ